MKLKEFAEKFDPDETIRVMKGDELIFEGKAKVLIGLSCYDIRKYSGTIIDGMMQVEIQKY